MLHEMHDVNRSLDNVIELAVYSPNRRIQGIQRGCICEKRIVKPNRTVLIITPMVLMVT
jgi:hypothetical protein